jgi:hypothetical protein
VFMWRARQPLFLSVSVKEPARRPTRRS